MHTSLSFRVRVFAAPKETWAASCRLGLILAILSASGCSKTANYAPATEQARKAVEIALAAWSKGDKIGNLEADGLKVEPEDFEWLAGKKLQKYEILDEVPGDEKTKQIRVQLTIVGAAPQTATYHVVGRGPIAVIRDKDFNRMSGM